ncbi:MAG: deoxyguanosinetriphosphate triphosphohydrolase [Gammaproteobacteria bacterium]|nr:deoxyguanosinetriphosphate triphosphohydrolase [Gammaproteobacteria bacterium]
MPVDLAPYAVAPSNSRGRRYREDPPAYRSEFQRDRDRIIHSTAFRRLVYKTQVFVNHEGDLYRTRLTHSLEVAQIARTVARAMRLNEDLVEAISLAHDLGHTPFGHAGQDALNDCMREFGGFEHNLQSLRVVDQLEASHADFPGLNLTFETREGILKHCSTANARRLGEIGERFLKRQQPGLEAQLVNIADEIAYNNHDVDDGLRSGLIKLADLAELPVVAEQLVIVQHKHPGVSGRREIHEVVRSMIGIFVTDLIDTSQARVHTAAPENIAAVRSQPRALIGFSEPYSEAKTTLKRFLRRHLYRHPQVNAMTEHAQQIVSTLFEVFLDDYQRMPTEHANSAREHHDSEGLAGGARVVADYIAGMTDRFAKQAHENLHNASGSSKAGTS